MYRVNKRSLSVLLLTIVVVLGMGYYVARYVLYGSDWAGAPFNQTAFQGGMLNVGTVTDCNGVVLAGVTDGRRTFASNSEVRRATLHAVGDREGNIGTGALTAYASELMGYNLITGSYSRSSNTGRTVALTIDSNLNLEAYRTLGGRRGAVMVSNYETGEVLCMVSSPDFDPSDPPAIADDETGVYLNRGIQSAYTPGSTFKLVTAAAAIEQIRDIDERLFVCEGELETSDDKVTCSGVHGTLGFTQGLRVSCNVVFGELALELGAGTLASYAEKYDLSGSSTIGGMRTMGGSFEKAESGTANLAWSGVGQYMNTMCPATMLRFVGAIANDGSAVELRLLQERGIATLLPNRSTRLMGRSTAQQLGDMMELQNRDNFPGLEVHAKSGTAQVGGDKEPHAWYVGYITNPDHPYAFVVIVENGGGGTAVAAPIANRVLQKMVK